MDEQNPSKISRGTMFLMGGVALLYEAVNFGLNFVPIIGDPIGTFLIGIVADLHFYVWFKMKGVSFSKKPSRAMVFFGAEFLELFPVLDEFAIIAGVVFTIMSVRAEEKLQNAPAVMLPKRKNRPAVAAPRQQRSIGEDIRPEQTSVSNKEDEELEKLNLAG